MVAGEQPVGSAFIGRDAQIRVLQAGLSDALAGRGRLFLIAGDPGIGKTRLADELATAAAARGARVLWGRCWDGDATPTYWPWTQLLRAYVQSVPAAPTSAKDIDDLFSMMPGLNRQGAEPGGGEESGEARFRLFDATALFLRRAADVQPLVLVLDDMHAADESSLLLLRFCARELLSARVLIICTYREAEVRLQRSLAAQFADLGREGHRIVMPGWDRGELEAWLRSRNDPRVPPRLAAEIHHVTDGNPFFVDEIAREIAAGRLDATALLSQSPLPVPDGVRQTIGKHLDTLPPATAELLAFASVIGLEFDVDVLRRLASMAQQCDLSPLPDVIGQLDPARAAGLLRELPGHSPRLAFVHALVRETLRNHMRPRQRMGLHLAVGEVLEQLSVVSGPVAPAQLAFHYFQAAAAGGAHKALHYARLAGDDALHRGAYEDAATLYAQALDALQFGIADPTLRGELLVALGRAQRRAGRIPEARAAFKRAARLAREHGWPDLAARAALGFGRVGETGAVDVELVDLLEQTLAELGGGDGALRARLLARLAMALYFSTDAADRARRETLSVQALDMARRVGESAALGAALIARHFVLWGPGATATRLALSAELIEIALQIGDQDMELEARLWHALDLLESGDGAGFLAEQAALEREAQAVRLPVHQWHVEVLRGLWALARGDLEATEAAAAAGRTLGEKYHIARAPQFFAAQIFHVRRQQNRLAELEPAVRAYAERFAALAVWQCGLALLYADLGRNEDARRAMDAALVVDPSQWPQDGNWLPCLVMLAEVAAALGDRARAAQLREWLAPHAGTQVVVFDGIALFGPVHHFLGLLAATLGDRDGARHHLTLAENECGRLGASALAERSRRALAALLGQPESAAPAPLSTTSADAPAERWVLRSEGAYWTVAFAGSESRVKHSRGLRYLAHLLRHPTEEFHALELASAEAGGSGAAGRRTPATISEPVIDDRARAAYRERLRDLQEELAEAEEHNDLGRIGRLQEEMDALTAELSRVLGLGGRVRTRSSDAERARSAVTKAITMAIRSLGRENPALREYLAQTVRTGTFCSYHADPDDARRWDLGG